MNSDKLTLEFCLSEIIKNNGSIRIGASILCQCFDGTVSVTDWHGKTVWFPQLDSRAVNHFMSVQQA